MKEVATICSAKRLLIVATTRNACYSVPVSGGDGALGFTEFPLFGEPVLATGGAGTLGLLYRLKGPLWLSDITLVTTPARRQTLNQSQVQQLDEAIRRNLEELGFWNKILLNILLESLNKPGSYLTKQKLGRFNAAWIDRTL